MAATEAWSGVQGKTVIPGIARAARVMAATERKRALSEATWISGAVVSTNLAVAKGTSKEPVSGIAIDSLGVVGDAHAGEWTRQVSLLAVESIERFSNEAGRSFGYGEFAENITTQGIDLLSAGLLDRFSLGSVELEVTQLGKQCHGGGCAIFREVGQCVMPRDGIFCRVVAGGNVKPGDLIVYRPRPLRFRVITLSDRAYKGVYPDASGPRIQEHIETFMAGKRWHPEVETCLLPDDSNLLAAELAAARDQGVDIVFTTGGTGIGPRDMTPDVVTALASKIIPGIMEHIRIKFGAEKPNALISRSVAAVLGSTLVYTLPGSVRAVDEYMGEILKTIEHSIRMLHALDIH